MTLEDLHDDLVAAGCNRNELAIALIEACIVSGMSDGSEIVRTVSGFGLNKASVGAQLGHNRGHNPARHRWFKTEAGHYRLHP